MERFEKLVEANKQLIANAKEIIRDQCQTILAMEEVDLIIWKQYTPYFNDGDGCVFGVESPMVFKADEEYDQDAEEYDYYEGGAYAGVSYSPIEPSEKLEEELGVLEDMLNFNDSATKELFGGDSVVRVFSDRIEIDEYDHD